jgi:hypothetical protein
MATITVVNNKIRVTPGVGEVDIVITIVQKTLVLDVITDVNISVSDPINVTTDSSELGDGVYSVQISPGTPAERIVFVKQDIEDQKSVYEVATIKTSNYPTQKDYNNYYDLISFSIRYDELITAIANYNTLYTIPFTSKEIIKYFDNMINYFKYDIS